MDKITQSNENVQVTVFCLVYNHEKYICEYT